MADARTNIAIDEALIRKVMRVYRLRTKKEAVDFALRALVGDRKRRDMLDLEGAGWEGDLASMRRGRVRNL